MFNTQFRAVRENGPERRNKAKGSSLQQDGVCSVIPYAYLQTSDNFTRKRRTQTSTSGPCRGEGALTRWSTGLPGPAHCICSNKRAGTSVPGDGHHESHRTDSLGSDLKSTREPSEKLGCLSPRSPKENASPGQITRGPRRLTARFRL